MKDKSDVGNLTDIPNDNYKKFFEKFKTIDNLPVEKWNTTSVLGYFIKKYKDHYKTDYKFKFNSPMPSKCFEVFQIKKLAQHLSADPVILKEYIDWVFTKKVVQAKRKLTSISFLTVEGVVNEYKINFLLAGKTSSVIERSTPLPGNYIPLLIEGNMTFLKTYGDLAMFSRTTLSPEAQTAFNKLETLGVSKEMLEKIV